MRDRSQLDTFERFTLWNEDGETYLHFMRLFLEIGGDNIEFLLRHVKCNISFGEMTTAERIMNYLPTVLTALACLAADRFMLWLLK